MRSILVFIIAAIANIAFANEQVVTESIQIKEPTVIEFKLPNYKLASAAQSIYPVILSGIVGLVAAFMGSYAVLRANRNTTQVSANNEEIKALSDQLTSFLVPYKTLAEANFNLAQDLRALNGFEARFLEKVFDTEWIETLSIAEKALFEVVCNNAQSLEKLIADRLVTVNPILMRYLSDALTHYRILSLAYEEKLGGDSTPFKKYAYPRKLDELLGLEIQRLNTRIEALRAEPQKQHGAIPSLNLS